MADNMRSIPSVLDGLQPGQRKVMFACFKRNLIKEMKVAELADYVSEQTAYHHVEASLEQTIIGLAQNFVGSNNINCLEPVGMFGSRINGGLDAAEPPYIFTRLSPFARKIFSPLDEPNLKFQYVNNRIEPDVYAPVIPMVLVNGADGIGTGWSTTIPNYHPIDIVNNLKRRMGRLDRDDQEERPFETMMPWFRGWKGTPEPAGPGRYKFNGMAYQHNANPNKVVITELPIRMWTDDFEAMLEKVISGVDGPSWIKHYKEFNDYKTVHFEIMVDEKHMAKVLEEGLLERFKLNKQVVTSKIVAFDTNGQIRQYQKVEEILEEYYNYRLSMYLERKKHWLSVYHAEWRQLQNQARFIKEIIDGDLTVGKKKIDVLVRELRQRKYEAFPCRKDSKKKGTEEEDDASEGEGDGEDDGIAHGGARDYDYLLSMPIWSLTAERLNKLNDDISRKKGEHDDLLAKSEKDLWCVDLDEFMVEWEQQLALDAKTQTSILADMSSHDIRFIDKGANDFATQADITSEEHIVAVIRRERPGDGIIAEESGILAPPDSSNGRVWLVDPLCGTVNYAAHTHEIAVNVALQNKVGQPVAAAVAHPSSAEVFWTGGTSAYIRRGGFDAMLGLRLPKLLPLVEIAWSTARRSQDLKVRVVQFDQLDDVVPTKRLLFRKITKGFDEKGGLLAKAQLQIQALEAQLAVVKPKKRKRVDTSPNSTFADIEAIRRAQEVANEAENDESDGTETEIPEIAEQEHLNAQPIRDSMGELALDFPILTEKFSE
ncbi:DNA topoisomerase 2 [Purpureocillium lavendulum]|uniref:DNA topoisomerase (ATP-hydrolyzing) n=1 Tax=Purpureocillium lavendulum TaxID=1247861 RepID=A0AB34FCQ5_9HYPO|nr:DNA topoisomerase 2 [Purpureocillium lavendulum]